MKKVLYILVVSLFLVVFTACNGNNETPPTENPPPNDNEITDNNDKIPLVNTFKEELSENYSFIDSNGNKYGNTPYATIQRYRLLVQVGDGIFVCYNGTFNPGLERELKSSPSDIYYVDENNNHSFIYTGFVGQLSYYDGYIYFSDWNYGNNSYYYSNTISRIKPNGENLEVIYENNDSESGRFNNFQIMNDKIYISGIYQDVFSINLNGENRQNIWSEYTGLYEIFVVEQSIFYSYREKLYKSDLNGENSVLLIEEADEIPCYVDSSGIYYYSKLNNTLKLLSLDGKEIKILGDSFESTLFNLFVIENELFYNYDKDPNEKTNLYKLEKIDIENGSKTTLSDDVTRNKYSLLTPIAINDWIYYDKVSEDENVLYTRVKIDGTENQNYSFSYS